MKTITMMQLRAQPGEYGHLVSRHGESFLVTAHGKPVFKIVPIVEDFLPVSDVTVIRPDGTVVGPKPLTFRENMGAEYV